MSVIERVGPVEWVVLGATMGRSVAGPRPASEGLRWGVGFAVVVGFSLSSVVSGADVVVVVVVSWGGSEVGGGCCVCSAPAVVSTSSVSSIFSLFGCIIAAPRDVLSSLISTGNDDISVSRSLDSGGDDIDVAFSPGKVAIAGWFASCWIAS